MWLYSSYAPDLMHEAVSKGFRINRSTFAAVVPLLFLIQLLMPDMLRWTIPG